MSSAALVDAGDHWRFRLKDARVAACCFDYAVVLRVLDGSFFWEIRLEQPFTLTAERGVKHVVVPHDGAGFNAVLTLLQAPVEAAAAYKDGRLELRMRNATLLHVLPDADYEAWSVTGPDDVRLVCLPGGDIAVWSTPLTAEQ